MSRLLHRVDKIGELKDKNGRYIFRKNPRPSGYSSENYEDNEILETADELNASLAERTAARNARETSRYDLWI